MHRGPYPTGCAETSVLPWCPPRRCPPRALRPRAPGRRRVQCLSTDQRLLHRLLRLLPRRLLPLVSPRSSIARRQLSPRRAFLARPLSGLQHVLQGHRRRPSRFRRSTECPSHVDPPHHVLRRCELLRVLPISRHRLSPLRRAPHRGSPQSRPLPRRLPHREIALRPPRLRAARSSRRQLRHPCPLFGGLTALADRSRPLLRNPPARLEFSLLLQH